MTVRDARPPRRALADMRSALGAPHYKRETVVVRVTRRMGIEVHHCAEKPSAESIYTLAIVTVVYAVWTIVSTTVRGI